MKVRCFRCGKGIDPHAPNYYFADASRWLCSHCALGGQIDVTKEAEEDCSFPTKERNKVVLPKCSACGMTLKPNTPKCHDNGIAKILMQCPGCGMASLYAWPIGLSVHIGESIPHKEIPAFENAADLVNLMTSGIITKDEARKMLGLPPKS